MKFLTAVIVLLAVYAHHCSGCEDTNEDPEFCNNLTEQNLCRVLNGITAKAYAEANCKGTCSNFCEDNDSNTSVAGTTTDTGGCYKKNTDIAAGKHYNATPADNYVKCQQLCQDNESCNMWSYTLDGIEVGITPRVCYLKSEENLQGENAHSREFLVTGPKECPGCYMENIDIAAGKHYDAEPAADYIQCQRRCQDNESCIMWTYSLDGITIVPPGVCFLKSEENLQGVEYTDQVHSRQFVVTGPKFCPDL